MSVQAMPARNADGKPFYIATGADHALASRYPGNLLENAKTVVAALDAGEMPSATMSECYYENITRGLVDYHETEEN